MPDHLAILRGTNSLEVYVVRREKMLTKNLSFFIHIVGHLSYHILGGLSLEY